MTLWLLDLDGTLYTDRTGLWPAISERITAYLQHRLGLNADDAWALRRRLVKDYGTTLRGLMAEYPGVASPEDYFAFTHDLPLEDYIAPAPRLREVLAALPGEKWVFTNADAAHAQRVLHILGVGDLFAGIIDIFATHLHPKPHPEAYRTALAIANHAAPSEAVVVDDRLDNLTAARPLGLRTVWVARHADPADRARVDATIPDIYHLTPAVIPPTPIPQGRTPP